MMGINHTWQLYDHRIRFQLCRWIMVSLRDTFISEGSSQYQNEIPIMSKALRHCSKLPNWKSTESLKSLNYEFRDTINTESDSRILALWLVARSGLEKPSLGELCDI